MNEKRYWLPTAPYTFDDAVQRFAMSMGIANPELPDVCSDNGKQITLQWNEYRQYYVAEYWYNGRNVVARGENFASCLSSAISACKRHGKGASLVAVCHKNEDAIECEKNGLVPYSSEIETAHDKTFIAWTADDIRAKFTPLQLQRSACGVYHF